MADWLKRAALRTGRRRLAFGLGALAVLCVHLWLSVAFDEMRLDWGEAAAMPQRLQVAYVRELALSEPPAAPPAPPKPVPRPRVPEEPAPAASTPAKPESPMAEKEPDPVPPPVEPEVLAQAASEPALAASEPTPEPVVAAASPAASAASAPAPFEWPASTRLSYVLTGNYRGEVHGSAQVEWIRQGPRYQVNLDVLIGPSFAPLISRRMSSSGQLTEQGLKPQRYDEDTKIVFRDRRRVSVLFEEQEVVLATGKREPMVPGMQDTASQFVQLTWLFLTQREQYEVGKRIEVPLALPRKLYRWRYEMVEEETLQTPMGPLPTWHLKPQLEAGGGDLTVEIWMAPRLQYLPVRLRIHQDPQTFIDLMLKAAPEQAAP